ncbi:MAG: transcription antitermination protein NusB, partial [Bacteroidia bacterium]
TIEKELEFLQLIKEKATNWETDRIALVDFLLMKMALCELLYYPQIPVKVTINEYLELAKQYSTPASHGFINGVLDKIQLELRLENKIVKTGRGLIE